MMDCLGGCTFENTPTYTLKGRVVACRSLKVYDGDTLWLAARVHGRVYKFRCRMLGYDSPEMKPPLAHANRLAEIAAAVAAKEFLENALAGRRLRVEFFDYDKYGRPLVTLWAAPAGWRRLLPWRFTASVDVDRLMVSSKHGKPYDGGAKGLFVEVV